MPRTRPRLPALTALLAASLLPGCQAAAKFADQHSFGPMLGPCARAMDSVQAARGKPLRRVVGDEEDTSSGVQRFEHEWGYPLEPASSDSLHVVRFRWEEHYKSCRVDQRAARSIEGPLLPPWEEAEER
jgi:hypothetical protein